MIYPDNFEQKLGFVHIRTALKGRCLSALGTEMVDKMQMLTDLKSITRQLEQVKEFRHLMEETDEFPDENFIDMRSALLHISTEGTYLEEVDLFHLMLSLMTIANIVKFLQQEEEEEKQISYPALNELTKDVQLFPSIIEKIGQLLNKYGRIRDDASPELARLRRQKESTRIQISLELKSILQRLIKHGYAPQDASPTIRESRLVIPIESAHKRHLLGIVHDESSTGKTVFIEPTEVVDANNKIRTIEAEERREIIRLLKDVAHYIRPQINAIVESYALLGVFDFIRAKSIWAEQNEAIEPEVIGIPQLKWKNAIHPLLQSTMKRKGKRMNALTITLDKEQGRILLISGPNAGGKSICLKTVGLLQYMLQCGMPIPIGEGSRVGIFKDIFIDIGDEQSIEDELSTYSGHLFNMKTMMKQAHQNSLILIDEMGGGTEPQIGAAIAQAMLHRFLVSGTWGIITTHYQNLKYFAQEHEGIQNGAMLYDRQLMQPLYHLQIGMPGSSFAIEIARKIGLPTEVISEASEIVGSDYIQSDKYLQDIMRDKRYWENKRQNIHQREKHLDDLINRYEQDLTDIASKRKEFINEAKQKAQEMLQESNAKIENTIRTIKESQAEKEQTIKARQSLQNFKSGIEDHNMLENHNADIDRKMRQIQQRKERQAQRKAQKQANNTIQVQEKPTENKRNQGILEVGQWVNIQNQQAVGKIESIKNNQAIVTVGQMRINVNISKLSATNKPSANEDPSYRKSYLSKSTRDSITEKSLNFRPSIDIRGMNGEEAINAVSYFVEDAILLGITPLRILHGTGSGYLRQIIRQYLKTVPQVGNAHDEHVQFGGAGITIVEMKW